MRKFCSAAMEERGEQSPAPRPRLPPLITTPGEVHQPPASPQPGPAPTPKPVELPPDVAMPANVDLPFELTTTSPLLHYFRGESGPNLSVIVKILQGVCVNRWSLSFTHPEAGRWRLSSRIAPQSAPQASPDINPDTVDVIVSGFEKEFRVSGLVPMSATRP